MTAFTHRVDIFASPTVLTFSRAVARQRLLGVWCDSCSSTAAIFFFLWLADMGLHVSAHKPEPPRASISISQHCAHTYNRNKSHEGDPSLSIPTRKMPCLASGLDNVNETRWPRSCILLLFFFFRLLRALAHRTVVLLFFFFQLLRALAHRTVAPRGFQLSVYSSR